jgi:predicted SAM-dependent methyltransferase
MSYDPKHPRIDLGGGHAPTPGHLNIDLVPEADIFWDLNKGLPNYKEFHDQYWGKVEGIRCHHLIEHLTNIISLMNDSYKILKDGAVMEISTPLAGTPQYWQDPTHVKGFVPESFLYFRQDSPFEKEQNEYGITARFEIVRCEVMDGWQLEATLKKLERL